MKSLVQNYKYYDSLWLRFDDQEAKEKRDRIIKSIPKQSINYFWKLF